jgi:hypothetical protein
MLKATSAWAKTWATSTPKVLKTRHTVKAIALLRNPKTVREALASPENSQWIAAIHVGGEPRCVGADLVGGVLNVTPDVRDTRLTTAGTPGDPRPPPPPPPPRRAPWRGQAKPLLAGSQECSRPAAALRESGSRALSASAGSCCALVPTHSGCCFRWEASATRNRSSVVGPAHPPNRPPDRPPDHLRVALCCARA